MNILIVGLGLIGGSYAIGLRKKGHKVFGTDINEETLTFAKEKEIIDEGSHEALDFIPKAEMIIIGLYPDKILDFLTKYQPYFNKNQIITDVCGIKTKFVYDAIKLAKPAVYLSHHPMAGREKVGIKYANPEIFKGANFLICSVSNTFDDISRIQKLASDLEFGRISVISPEKHDKMIGFTSQLTHAIAVSLVNSDTENDTKMFIGDSYRDLTRIAMINENLWSELFFANRDYLLGEISNFECEIEKLKICLEKYDEKTLKEIFIKSRKTRSEMEKWEAYTWI